jgi:hypothetical protein
MTFTPKPDEFLTIALPNELLRAKILKVVTNDAIIVRIASEPLARLAHNYTRDQVVSCRRYRTMFGEEWRVVVNTGTSIETLEEQEKKHAAETGKRAKGDKRKHKGVNAPRKSTKKPRSDRSDSVIKRKKVSKGK